LVGIDAQSIDVIKSKAASGACAGRSDEILTGTSP
jgi:hypothetical protein